MMRHTPKVLTALCLTALLAGCTLAPVYQRPAPPLPADWTSGTPPQAQPGAQSQDWRKVIADKPLADLVELALANNRDVRAAALRIEHAQAHYQVVRADLFPKIDGFAKAELNRTPGRLLTSGTPRNYHAYVVGVGFSNYELDFFGRVRSLKDEALELFLSTETSHKSIEFSMVAEVATIYVRTVADREHSAAAAEILKSEQDAFDLVKHRHAEGAASEIDLHRAQSSLDIARTNAAKFKAQAIQDENQLSVLVGMPLKPEQIPAQKLADIVPMNPVPAGLPSEVLTRRPDVLTAEHELKAANAHIGAARALHFPIISLTSSIGTASDQISGLFKAGSWAWSIAPQLSVPIFHSGAIDATVNESIAYRDILVAKYEKAVQVAFREVSDCLAANDSLNEQVSAQSSLVNSSRRIFELANARYEAGQDSSLARLDAVRAYSLAQHDYISAREFHQSNLMTLYKALGGGWQGEDEPEQKKDEAKAQEPAKIQEPAKAQETPKVQEASLAQ